jgi:DUF4097 and DUF4098 domain-containing protein YvlB
MNLRLLALATVSFCVVAFARADDYPIKEPFSRSAPFDADGRISLHNVNGNISIEAWDKNEISIEGEKSARTEEELKAIELTIDLSATRADIKVHFPKRKEGWFGNNIRAAVSFKLKVPATGALDEIKVVNSSVKIDGVRGSVAAESVNGQVRAQNLGGDARLQTVNGQVNASFAAIHAHQKLSFRTVNGSVRVALPADAGFELASSVVNGHVDCDFPLQIRGRVGGKRVNGTVGDGRASLHASSVNGGIHLEQRDSD